MLHSQTYFDNQPAVRHPQRSQYLDVFDITSIVAWVLLTNAIFFMISVCLHRAMDTIGLVNFNTTMSWLESGRWYDVPVAVVALCGGWLWRYSIPKSLYRYERTFKGDSLSELGHGIATGISLYMLICFLVVSMSLFATA